MSFWDGSSVISVLQVLRDIHSRIVSERIRFSIRMRTISGGESAPEFSRFEVQMRT